MEVHPLKLAREVIVGLGKLLARAAGISNPDSSVSNESLSEAEQEIILTSRRPREGSSDSPRTSYTLLRPEHEAQNEPHQQETIGE